MVSSHSFVFAKTSPLHPIANILRISPNIPLKEFHRTSPGESRQPQPGDVSGIAFPPPPQNENNNKRACEMWHVCFLQLEELLEQQELK